MTGFLSDAISYTLPAFGGLFPWCEERSSGWIAHLLPSLQITPSFMMVRPTCVLERWLWIKLHDKAWSWNAKPPPLKCHLTMLKASSRISWLQHRPRHGPVSLWLLIVPLFSGNWRSEASLTNADRNIWSSWCWNIFISNYMANVLPTSLCIISLLFLLENDCKYHLAVVKC